MTEAGARAEIRRRFFADPWGVDAEDELSGLADRIVADRLAGRSMPVGCALLAAGGYGRRTLHPMSDLDFLFLFGGEADAGGVREVLGALGDPGFEVGFQTRSLADFSSFEPGEIGSYTAFFETRHMAGDRATGVRFAAETLPRFLDTWRDRFLQALEAERASRVARHANPGAAPDIKNGPGGLRDYHWILWASRVGGRPVPREVAEPVRLLHRIRNFLHYLTGRDDNVLDSRLGGEIGDHLGLGAEGLNREVRKALSAVLECRGRVGKALGGESPAAESSPRPDPRYTL